MGIWVLLTYPRRLRSNRLEEDEEEEEELGIWFICAAISQQLVLKFCFALFGWREKNEKENRERERLTNRQK